MSPLLDLKVSGDEMPPIVVPLGLTVDKHSSSPLSIRKVGFALTSVAQANKLSLLCPLDFQDVGVNPDLGLTNPRIRQRG